MAPVSPGDNNLTGPLSFMWPITDQSVLVYNMALMCGMRLALSGVDRYTRKVISVMYLVLL